MRRLSKYVLPVALSFFLSTTGCVNIISKSNLKKHATYYPVHFFIDADASITVQNSSVEDLVMEGLWRQKKQEAVDKEDNNIKWPTEEERYSAFKTADTNEDGIVRLKEAKEYNEQTKEEYNESVNDRFNPQ